MIRAPRDVKNSKGWDKQRDKSDPGALLLTHYSSKEKPMFSYSQWLKNIVENIPITFSFIICRQTTTRKSSNYCKFWTSIAFKTKIWKMIYFLHILPNSCLFTVRTSKNFKSKQERKNLVCAILSSEKSLGKAKHPSNHHRWNGSASKN